MAVTFTYSTPGTYTAETDTWATPATTSISGNAIQVRGDPEVYKALSLIESEAPTLLFVPTTYGGRVEPGYTVEWSNLTYTAQNVRHVAPDGVVIVSYITVSR